MDLLCGLSKLSADISQVNVFNDKDDKKQRQSASTDKENSAAAEPPTEPAEKPEAEIQQEIQSLFRQITASVTFLPMLDGNCTFNVLVYADADSDVPLEWGDSDAKEVKNAEKVMLRSFSTNNHKIDTLVSYRYVPSRAELLSRLLTESFQAGGLSCSWRLMLFGVWGGCGVACGWIKYQCVFGWWVRYLGLFSYRQETNEAMLRCLLSRKGYS